MLAEHVGRKRVRCVSERLQLAARVLSITAQCRNTQEAAASVQRLDRADLRAAGASFGMREPYWRERLTVVRGANDIVVVAVTLQIETVDRCALAEVIDS